MYKKLISFFLSYCYFINKNIKDVCFIPVDDYVFWSILVYAATTKTKKTI